MRITADTNFLISATQWDASVSHKLLLKLISLDAEVYTTEEILEEFTEILERDFRYPSQEANAIKETLLGFVYLVAAEEKIDIVKDDPDDNKILACAIASRSDYILTYDKHLLRIKEFKGIKIVQPEELLKRDNL